MAWFCQCVAGLALCWLVGRVWLASPVCGRSSVGYGWWAMGAGKVRLWLVGQVRVWPARSVCGRPGPCVAGQVRVWLARYVCGWCAVCGWLGLAGLAGLGWARLGWRGWRGWADWLGWLRYAGLLVLS